MSPFGSHAMLQGFLSPSATVTTLNFSPGGPGGCASAVQLNVAATTRPAAARIKAENTEGVFMSDLNVLGTKG